MELKPIHPLVVSPDLLDFVPRQSSGCVPVTHIKLGKMTNTDEQSCGICLSQAARPCPGAGLVAGLVVGRWGADSPLQTRYKSSWTSASSQCFHLPVSGG